MNFKKVCEQWGRWASPRLGTEFPCVSAGVMGATPKNKIAYLPPVSDEFGLMVDNMVLTMEKHAPELYEAFMLRYVYQDDEAYKRMNISRKQFYIHLSAAEMGLKLMLARVDWVFG